jgi:hypothetical protein
MVFNGFYDHSSMEKAAERTKNNFLNASKANHPRAHFHQKPT